MDVDIEGKTIRLDQQQVIGLGGEGTVFLTQVSGQPSAVKVYHTPTSQRQEKLLAFLARHWMLPSDKIALPLQLVRDLRQGNVIGFTMSYLDAGFEEIAHLARKKHRAAHALSNRQITSIFLDGALTLERIHRCGLVVGDFNDQNVFYKDERMLWIDVDAWQFSCFPCPVGTEDFLAPELYGIDLRLKPVFKPEHDWYAYAVHLFNSLLLIHPYGGTHKTVQSLPQRAIQRIFVLNSNVIYPKLAYHPDLLSDEFAEVFDRIFSRGWRGPFPLEVLQRYQDALIECSACTGYYPRERGCCPLCQSKALYPQLQSVVSSAGVSNTELMRTNGKIVFYKVQGQTLYVLASEEGNVVLYSKKPGMALKRKELFKEIPGMQFDLIGDTLIMNAPGRTQLSFVTISGEKPILLCDSETAIFAGRGAVFKVSDRHIFSIQNNALMCSSIIGGALIGRPLRLVMEKQTWFTAARSTDDAKPSIFGFFQVFRQHLYWFMRGQAVYDVLMPTLQSAETLLDIVVHFSGQDMLIRRYTQESGIDYLRTERVDYQAQILYTSGRIKRSDHPYPQLHGQAYSAGIILHPSDKGIVQEKVEQGTFKTFSATEGYVQEGDSIEPYRAGLLIVGENRVSSLVL